MDHVEISSELTDFLKTNQSYQNIFDRSSDIVFFTSLDGMIVETNSAAEKALGLTKEELLQTNFKSHVHSEDLEFVIQSYHHSRSNEMKEIEIRLKHKTKGFLPVKLTNVPIIVDNKMIGLCGLARNITVQKEQKDNIVQLSYYDQLTGLPNRMLFEKTLKKRISDSICDPSSTFALVLLELNRYHSINEILGYTVGNQLIKETAKRLSKVVKPEDSFCRIGNDEFAFLIPIDSQLNGLLDKVQLILRTLDEPFLLENIEFFNTANIGISLYQKTEHDDMTLFKHAETALSRAKLENKQVEVYNPEMDVQTYKTFTLEHELRKALDKKEFEVYYQPRINTATNQIISAEALIRWNHPKWGQLSPGEFISLAERNGTIHSIGMWVLETVCKQIKSWEIKDIPLKRISVNFSALQLLKPGIVHEVMEVIHKNKVNPNAIEIEITEQALMSNKELMKKVTADFAQLGIHIAIDDFGTGYSSLSYLLNFKINTLKIDRSFIKDLATNEDSKEITSAIIKLGQKLNLNLVAEGVETAEQLSVLRGVQCNEIQGYLYSKAVTAQEISNMLLIGKLEPNQTVCMADVFNQRKFFRIFFPCPLEADMTIDEINKVKVNVGKTLIAIENLGPGGLGFLTNIRLPNKRGIILAFDTYILGHSLKLYGQLVWSREVRDHHYEYGVELLIDEAERADLTNLLNQLQIQFRRYPNQRSV